MKRRLIRGLEVGGSKAWSQPLWYGIDPLAAIIHLLNNNKGFRCINGYQRPSGNLKKVGATNLDNRIPSRGSSTPSCFLLKKQQWMPSFSLSYLVNKSCVKTNTGEQILYSI